jgi:hypothetical protein
MTFPYYKVRQTVDHMVLHDQKYPPFRWGDVDRVTVGDADGFLRLQCPCQKEPFDLWLNIRLPHQEPFYTFYVGEDRTLTVAEQIVTPWRGCKFWLKEGQVIGFIAGE